MLGVRGHGLDMPAIVSRQPDAQTQHEALRNVLYRMAEAIEREEVGEEDARDGSGTQSMR